jgi:four helix bundle protein
MASLKSFEELECWKEAVSLRKEIRILIKTLPPEEKYKLIDQLSRASRSVTANIAEGFGRFHYLENSKFCRNSRGSLTEILDHLILAEEEGYIDAEKLKMLRAQVKKCIIILNGYINYLIKAKYSEVSTNNK